MPRHHLAFRNFKPSITAAAVELFDAKPWALDTFSDEQNEVAQKFSDQITTAYQCDPVKVRIEQYPRTSGYIESDSYYGEIAQIVMGSWSIFTLMTNLRTHVLTVGGAIPIGDEPSEDPTKWAASLFYSVKPVMFRARVRDGRINAMVARDTYSAESWEKLVEAGLTYGDRLTGDSAQWHAVVNGLPMPVASLTDSIEDEDEIDLDDEDFANAMGEMYADLGTSSESAPVEPELEATSVDSVWATFGAMSRDQIRALAVQNNIARQGRNKDQLIAALVSAGVTP